MGEHGVGEHDEAELRAFTRALLDDVQALERMLGRPELFDTERHIGAEQEMFLVDERMRPSAAGPEVLARIEDPRVTTELARFNLEANASPRRFGGRCLSELEAELAELVATTRAAANACGADVVLAGILPTLRKSDLGLDMMAPEPRYYALNDAMAEMRGGRFHVIIEGVDELEVTHDNVMFEACNTSFQAHYQVSPEEFAPTYNVAQLITAPLLAAAANSPLLLGRRLWHETRIALFAQSVDVRSEAHAARRHPARVGFGGSWVERGVVEVYREAIARFRVLLARGLEASSTRKLAEGEVPALEALQLFNSTTYRWNRPCYGAADGLAHLRIESRALPSGPTIADEVANAALFFGLLSAGPAHWGDPREKMAFDDAKTNFVAAARAGLRATFRWIDGRDVGASELLTGEVLPLAREGLARARIDAADIDRFLGIVEARVAKGRNGATWALGSLEAMNGANVSSEERLRALTRAMLANQRAGRPVHEWEPAQSDAGRDWRIGFGKVGQLMSSDLFTVRPEDVVDLAACLMDWEHVRHVPVEDDQGRLVGIVSHRALLRLMANGQSPADSTEPVPVADIMTPAPYTCSPDTPTLEAIRTMREKRVSCLPVVEDGKLVGILTDRDLIDVSARILEEELR